MVPPDVAVFDLGGVVCRFDSQARLDGLAQACGSRLEVVQDALFTSGFDRDCDRGIHPAEDLWHRVRALGFRGSMDELANLWALAFQPCDDVLALVRQCRERRPTALLTDNGHLLLSALPRVLPTVAEAFDQLLFSCTLGSVKPDPAVFEAALTRLSVPAERAFFVDDSERNVAAARRAGLRAETFTDADALARDLRATGLID
ncbi:putative hydrolase of the HAD superfamily [Micromonospora phaseoli]|uniref:Putative hydrolase of the HAD superfamily n=1 Tax=Micromonospora phaseoli TaxID=1144548 RepID=A0A1H6YN82_9ACTN|nr:putative hydrolase of the HAD superfamily [Micromonospora phaseoli]SEJ42739.1 putative hydrolase of the HAD superfamily [Micromonospora phaseoli]